MGVIRLLLVLYELILFARIIASWFPLPPSGPVRAAYSFVYAVTEPVLRPLRNLLPPLRFGAMGLDLSPTVVFIVIGILLANLR